MNIKSRNNQNNNVRSANAAQQAQLDFTVLRKAIKSMHKAIKRSTEKPKDEELRDAVIQRFEYTFELCWKMLKRRLELDVLVPAALDLMSFKVLMREAAERGYVDEVTKWLIYREQRNITSHTYNAKKAKSVYKTACKFYVDANVLLSKLEARNHD